MSALFHASYWSYYPLLLLPIGYFSLTRNWFALRRTMYVVILTLLACYLVFLTWPVVGPYYEFARPDAWFLDNGPARLVYAMLASGSSYGAAFPSSHVAATIAATSGAWRGDRRLGMFMLVPMVLLIIAVVYCQMHYGIDALTGIGERRRRRGAARARLSRCWPTVMSCASSSWRPNCRGRLTWSRRSCATASGRRQATAQPGMRTSAQP